MLQYCRSLQTASTTLFSPLLLAVVSWPIINSSNTTEDSRVSNRLLYEDGAPQALLAPENMLCVAGNIMSRGVTVEGLTVTFYGRDSQIPLGDASLQHARWMGHKGEDEVGTELLHGFICTDVTHYRH